METVLSLIPLIAEKIRQAQHGLLVSENIYRNTHTFFGKNNWLFFIKPEITQPLPSIKLEAILELVLSKIEGFDFHIHDVKILSADYLKQYDLIRQHYGVIDDVALLGRKALTTKGKEKFLEIFGVPADDVKVLGGLEFLDEYPFFNAHSLDCLWQNSENQKLASGTYAEKVRVDLETVYLLNAFHPRQLEHFTEKGRSIVVMNLSGDLAWRDARARFAGATNPLKAEKGSLRRELLENKDTFGIPDVSQSYNGIHLSAGPVEALIELRRFESDFSAQTGALPFDAFPFGRQLMQAVGCIPGQVEQNALIQAEGRRLSVFDLTEDMDADEAIRLLKQLIG